MSKRGEKRGGLARVEAAVNACLDEQIAPALEAVRDELQANGHEVALEYGDGWIELGARNYNGLILKYKATGHVYKQPVRTFSELANADELPRYGRIAIESGGRRREYRLWRCRRAAIQRAAQRYYRRFLMVSPEG